MKTTVDIGPTSEQVTKETETSQASHEPPQESQHRNQDYRHKRRNSDHLILPQLTEHGSYSS